MAAYSVHIAVDEVDANAYKFAVSGLNSPIHNAEAMEQLALCFGVAAQNRSRYHGKAATKSAIIGKFSELAKACKKGDFIFVSYSGHGSQVEDLDNAEEDGWDEALILFDDNLVDDELCHCWRMFEEGVKIFLLADACHSGTLLKPSKGNSLDLRPCVGCNQTPRVQGCDCCCEDGSPIRAAVLSLSAVRDNQEAQDGENFSKFTKAVMSVFDNGQFSGSFNDFHAALKRHEMSSRFRLPELRELGNCAYYFKSQYMFHFKTTIEYDFV